jgi:acid ceramidase
MQEVKCQMTNSYPPPESTAIPTYVIDLDQPAATRWAEALTPRAAGIRALLAEVLDKLPQDFVTLVLDYLNHDDDVVLTRIPSELADEMRGIATITGLNIGEVFLYNIFYEVSSLCTSIVAQDDNGNVYHARNLDFGLFLGWDKANETWAITELLRPLLFNAQFQSNGVTIFNATQYGGYVGVLTGFKKGGFSITVDTRYSDEYDVPLVEWLNGKYTGSFVGFLNRQVLTSNTTYSEALAFLSNSVLIAPVYLILGGSSAGEGAVITRNITAPDNVWSLSAELQNGSFFLLQTNYDHWKPAPWFDDRSGPGTLCMQQLGQDRVGFAGLFDVLSGKPNLNQLTTYTALMHVATGEFQTFLQDCPHPCPPW